MAITLTNLLSTSFSTYSNSDVIALLGSMTADMIPAANNTYNLGSQTKRWNDLFMGGDVTANSFDGDGSLVTNVDAATLSGNTATDLQSYADTIAGTAYSNATSYAATIAGTAYSNATSYADTAVSGKLDTTTWTGSAASSITGTQVSNWDTAYGWGNHASAGYQAAASAITTSNIGSQSVAAVVKTVTGTNTAELVRGNMADNDQFRILIGGSASNAGYAEIATADDGTEPIYVRQYTGVFSSLLRTLTLLDGSGNTTFPGNVLVGSSSFSNDSGRNNYLGVSATSASAVPGIILKGGSTYPGEWTVGLGAVSGGNEFFVWDNDNERLKIDSDGNLFSNITTRSPIFYDSDNTAYYVDPASTSRIGGIQVSSPSNSENYIAFRGTTGDSPGNYDHGYIGERNFSGTESTELLLFKGNDTEGVSGPDRIRLFASNICFDTYTAVTSGSFSTVGASANALRRMTINQAGNITAEVDFRAPIFYDSNNTAYYTNPNSTSVMSSIYLDDAVYHNGDTNTYMQFHVEDQWRVVTAGIERLEVSNAAVKASITFASTGDVIAYFSDERLKDFHGNIKNAVNKICSIGGYYFTENEKAKELGYNKSHMQIGVNAQEVLKVFPEVVTTAAISFDGATDEEYLTVQYEKLVPVLIEAIKEQQQQIQELNSKLEKLL